jgi:hypothetical protein
VVLRAEIACAPEEEPWREAGGTRLGVNCFAAVAAGYKAAAAAAAMGFGTAALRAAAAPESRR